MGKQIKIRIYPDGKIESQTINIKGKSCLKYIQPLESMLDAKVVDSEFTKDYYDNTEIISVTDNVELKL